MSEALACGAKRISAVVLGRARHLAGDDPARRGGPAARGASTGCMAAVKKRAFEHRRTVMIGRSHGIHAEPITFGHKLAIWYDELRRGARAAACARRDGHRGGEDLRRGGHLRPPAPGGGGARLPEAGAARPRRPPARSSSATGTPSTSPPWRCSAPASRSSPWRSATCSAPRCGRRRSRSPRGRRAPRPCPTSATRSSRRTSPAWPGCCAGYALAALENVALWHERDISPLLGGAGHRPGRHRDPGLHAPPLRRADGETCASTRSRCGRTSSCSAGVVHSQRVLLELARKGIDRQAAYVIVQRNAMRMYEEGVDFRTALLRTRSSRRG